MANAWSCSLTAQWRSLWHTLTVRSTSPRACSCACKSADLRQSNDRHATYDSPYRTGQHVALPQSKNTPLTSSAATSALDSRTDLGEDLESGRGFAHSNGRVSSPGELSRPQRQRTFDSKVEGAAPGGIQMQSFSDGLPPPPPAQHSWGRIGRWLEDNYEELYENLGAPATVNDVNELENELDCTLPQEVRESLQLHDGQERGGLPTGIVFGCMLLDCEEIIQEWQNWRTINEVYFSQNERSYEVPQAPIKAFASSSSSAIPLAQAQQSANPPWRQELFDKQDSQPSNAIQKVYAHPAWIPLARDWGGNNICVDLAPGPAGKWGQIILMGRDYDCKYVISRSWAAFLATLADDMNTDKWWINEETGELKLREFKQQGVEPAYIDILRWRADQKYGRKGPKKRPSNSNTPGVGGANGFSPYGSPVLRGQDDRGRSPHRLSNGKAPVTNSPRPHMSRPLAIVAEETPQLPRLHTGSDSRPRPELVMTNSPNDIRSPKLSESSDGEEKKGSLARSKLSNSTSGEPVTPTGLASKPEEPAAAGAEDMKDVEI